MPNKPAINLHIERLIVNGMSRPQAALLQSSMQQELAVLLPGLSVLKSANHLNMSTITIPAESVLNPRRAGRVIARKIHHGLQLRGSRAARYQGGPKNAGVSK